MYTGDDSGRVLTWDRQTREYEGLYELGRLRNRRQAVWHLALAAASTRLLVPAADRIHVINLPEGTPGPHLRDTSTILPRVEVSADGRRVVTVSRDQRVAVWDAKTLERQDVSGPLAQLSGLVYAALIDDGKRVLIFRQPGAEVSMWDMRSGERVGVLDSNDIWCRVCALAPDRRAFAACVSGGTNVCVYGLPDWANRTVIRHDRQVESLTFHPNGELLALTDGTGDVALWNTTTGDRVGAWNWRIGRVRGVAFAPDGLTCAVGGFGRFAVFDVDL
ncbi:WD40 repeat domain-containing protein [Frigoriglobus tundricola]|uniref:Uncharacterized protein n=1 Tax=Frigoriglobus tundricola TaxID=2774151 RepID=A0A6M5YTW7_9BACT|nr:hypothetical protein [Frigoriglobus tundricola]QJW96372.1 hypothetical protein FTUN_3929 [Frigoriglobus tundricola]